jgi:hypothetical protein
MPNIQTLLKPTVCLPLMRRCTSFEVSIAKVAAEYPSILKCHQGTPGAIRLDHETKQKDEGQAQDR